MNFEYKAALPLCKEKVREYKKGPKGPGEALFGPILHLKEFARLCTIPNNNLYKKWNEWSKNIK